MIISRPPAAKVRVLFVDDDVSLVNALRRTLYDMRGEWDMSFADGGEKALAEMIESALVVHRFELRRANIWLEDLYKGEGKPDVARLSAEVRRYVNRERLKRLGIHLGE
jgi:hypothetical protein